MADYLLVIDMQTDYVGETKSYPSQLLSTVNKKINAYPPERVIYVLNRFLWELPNKPKKFAAGLAIVSNQVFEKRRASCFTNRNLLDFLAKSAANHLEFIGVDGNHCINASVLAAAHKGYQVSVDLTCLGAINTKKFQKTLQQWRAAGIITKGE
ncbi:isochorismatase family protein [Streptococcus orisasini]